MNRPVCGTCSVEMHTDRIGVVVQYNALVVGGAYEQWHADTHRCPSCGAVIVSRFAENASWRHFQPDRTPETPDFIVEERRGVPVA